MFAPQAKVKKGSGSSGTRRGGTSRTSKGTGGRTSTGGGSNKRARTGRNLRGASTPASFHESAAGGRRGGSDGYGVEKVRRWIQVKRPPAIGIGFSVPMWVPLDNLTEEEKEIYLKVPDPDPAPEPSPVVTTSDSALSTTTTTAAKDSYVPPITQPSVGAVTLASMPVSVSEETTSSVPDSQTQTESSETEIPILTEDTQTKMAEKSLDTHPTHEPDRPDTVAPESSTSEPMQIDTEPQSAHNQLKNSTSEDRMPRLTSDRNPSDPLASTKAEIIVGVISVTEPSAPITVTNSGIEDTTQLVVPDATATDERGGLLQGLANNDTSHT